jgi:hypothetical protein
MIGGLNNPRGCVIGGFLLGVLEVHGQPVAGAVARGGGVRAGDRWCWRSGRPACSAPRMVEKV